MGLRTRLIQIYYIFVQKTFNFFKQNPMGPGVGMWGPRVDMLGQVGLSTVIRSYGRPWVVLVFVLQEISVITFPPGSLALPIFQHCFIIFETLLLLAV